MIDKLVQEVKLYKKYGFQMLPASGKYPSLSRYKEYRDKEITPEMFKNLANNTLKDITGIALFSGEMSGVTIVDIDFKNGAVDVVGEYLKKNGIIVPTVRTGSGGLHYYFKYAGDIGSPTGFLQGIDLRNGNRLNAFISILPPSIHPTTNKRYEWIHTMEEGQLIELPSFLLEHIKEKKFNKTSYEINPKEGQRNQTFVGLLGGLLPYLPREKFVDLAYPIMWGWNKGLSSPLPKHEFDNSFKSIAERELGKRLGIVEQDNNYDDIIDKLFESVVPMETGISSIDEQTGGFLKGQLAILLGDSGVGKSIVGLNMLIGASKKGYKTCYIDLENGKVETLKRVFSIYSGYPISFFDKVENKDRVREVLTNLKNFDYLSYEDMKEGEINVKEAIDILKSKVAEGFKIFLIDPFTKLLKGVTSQSQNVEEGRIAGSLKDFATKNDISIFVLHHVRKGNRQSSYYTEEEIDKALENRFRMPTMQDSLGSSKVINFSTDVWGYLRTPSNKGLLKVLKSRSGAGKGEAAKFTINKDNLKIEEEYNETALYKNFNPYS